MANFCNFEFRVIGNKNAVRAFYLSTPFLDWREVDYENGTDSNYEMRFKGNCKWSINFDVVDRSPNEKLDLKYCGPQQIDLAAQRSLGYSVRVRSEIFQCEVRVHYWSMESEFDQFDHYKNGKCLKKRKIAFDNYEEEENFDWDTLEFIGHEGEDDESVDGEQRAIGFMDMLRGMPRVSVPSQKPKKINEIENYERYLNKYPLKQREKKIIDEYNELSSKIEHLNNEMTLLGFLGRDNLLEIIIVILFVSIICSCTISSSLDAVDYFFIIFLGICALIVGCTGLVYNGSAKKAREERDALLIKYQKVKKEYEELKSIPEYDKNSKY